MPGSVARRLREAAKAAGMSASAISKESGISESTVRRALAGDGDITLTTLTAICGALQVSAESVISGRQAEPEDWGIKEYYDSRIEELHGMYDKRIEVNKSLYERRDEEQSRWRQRTMKENRFQRVLIVILVVFILWLLLFDRHMPSFGMIQYDTLEDFLITLEKAGYTIVKS